MTDAPMLPRNTAPSRLAIRLGAPMAAVAAAAGAASFPLVARAETGGVYAGAGFIPRFAYYGGGYYRATPDLVAEGEVAYGSYSLKFNGNGVESKRLHITARGRYFLGSSFNLSTGVAFDQLSDSTTYDSTDAKGTAARIELSSNVSQIEFELGLGNRWTLGSFLIGCDWIGVGIPVIPLGVKTEANAAAKAQGKVDDFESDAKAHAKAISYHVMKLQLGYAF